MSADHGSGGTETTLDVTSTSSAGCVECRTRRLYCETDAANPRQACGSCVRNGYICSNVTSIAAVPQSTRLQPQNRVQKAKDRAPKRIACDWCRRQKVRCSGDSPCSACAIRDQACVYPAGSRRQPNDESAAAHGWQSGPAHGHQNGSPSTNLQPGQIYQVPAPLPRLHVARLVPDIVKRDYYLDLDKEVIAEYIEAFFRFVYPVSCMSFLHQPTFLRQWHTHTVNVSLLKVVCACALRVFSTTQGDNERAAHWMHEAELDALQNLGDLTMPRLQALTLLAFFEFTYHIHSAKALMLLGLAARLALAKRLNYEDHTLSVVEQESRRRLMWSIFVLDKFCSGGVAELTLVSAEHMEICLPAIERAFGFGQRTDTEILRPQAQEGVANSNAKGMDEFAYTIRLIDLLRNKIHKFTKHAVAMNESLYTSAQKILALDSAIDTIERQIPQDLKWDKMHLQKRMYDPGLSSYIMLHTWRLQCKLDLHRLTMLGSKDCISEAALRNTPLSFAQDLRSKCLLYAIELTNMWAEVLDLNLAKPVHDAAISGCSHQCAKILTLMPVQVGYSEENKATAVYVCQMMIEPLKDIFPKAKILYDDVCRMRSNINTIPIPDTSNAIQHVDEHDIGVTIPANDEDHVRSLLNQYNA